MKRRVLTHILKILAAVILLSILVDKLVFSLFNVISDEVYTGQSVGKLNHYLKIKDGMNVLVYGNSRVRHHVDPQKMGSNCFNIGVNGRKIAYSNTLVNLLETPKEQTILFHIDTENAFSETYTGRDIQALSVKYNRDMVIKRRMDELDMNNPFQRVLRSLSYNTIILGILKNYFWPNYDYKTYNGFDPIRVSEDQRKIFMNKLDRENDEEPNCRSDLKLNDVYRKELIELKEFCDRRNKRIIMFTSPIFTDPCDNDNRFLAKHLGKLGFEYYDFTNLFQEDNNLEYWKDRIHLSGRGAEIFTEKLRQRLSEDEVTYF